MGQTTGGKEKQLARQPLLRNSAEHLMLMLIGMRQSRWGGACRGVLGFAPTVRGARGGGGRGSRLPRLSPGTGKPRRQTAPELAYSAAAFCFLHTNVTR